MRCEVGAIQAGDRSYDLFRRIPPAADNHVVLVQRLGQSPLHGLRDRSSLKLEPLSRDDGGSARPRFGFSDSSLRHRRSVPSAIGALTGILWG
jgi:hypothetical protein